MKLHVHTRTFRFLELNDVLKILIILWIAAAGASNKKKIWFFTCSILAWLLNVNAKSCVKQLILSTKTFTCSDFSYFFLFCLCKKESISLYYFTIKLRQVQFLLNFFSKFWNLYLLVAFNWEYTRKFKVTIIQIF